MKAAIFSGINSIQLQDVDYVSPRPGYLTVKTKCTAICGSELNAFRGTVGGYGEFARGHETSGVVYEVGEGVTSVKPGDRVTVEAVTHCGKCVYCRTGNYNVCPDRKAFFHFDHGGYAEYMTVYESQTFKIPDHISFEQAALVEPLAVSYRAFLLTKAGFRERVGIIGGGTIGLLCLAVAKYAGVRETIITVKYDQQADLARSLGADHVVDVNETDIKESIVELTNGFGVDAVIVTVGGGRNLEDSLAVARQRGTIVLESVPRPYDSQSFAGSAQGNLNNWVHGLRL